MRNLAFLVGAVMVGVVLFTPRPESAAPKALVAETARPAKSAAPRASGFALAGEAEVLTRDETGQFHIDAAIDGQDVRFLVDTGADVVALTLDDADRLGIRVDPSEFRPLTRTASGVGYGTQVTLDRLEVAGAEFHQVPAVVIEGLSVNLLGQDVLRRLGKVELDGDRMVIRR